VIGMAFGLVACGGSTTGSGGQRLDGNAGGGGVPGEAEASGGSGANDPAGPPPAETGGASTGGMTSVPPIQGLGGTPWTPPVRGTGGGTWVTPVYPDGGSFPPTVDASGLPLGTCRSGPLYYRSGTFMDSNSIPVERQEPPEVRPSWANTSNLDELAGSSPSRWNLMCQPWGLGLADNGVLRFPPGDGDLRPILSGAATPAPTYSCNDYVACHSGGRVGVTWDCGSVPQGTGGVLNGVYALVGYVTYDQATYPKLGALISQTLYIAHGRALLVSNDDNNMGLVGTYTYAIDGNVVSFTANCESQGPDYRAFPAQATFTATPSGLELFDSVRNIRSTFVLVTPAE
jgi:hypothetical protein